MMAQQRVSADMVDNSKSKELKRLIAEAEHLRTKLMVARDGHTRDGETLARLEHSVAVFDRENAETSFVLGERSSKRR